MVGGPLKDRYSASAARINERLRVYSLCKQIARILLLLLSTKQQKLTFLKNNKQQQLEGFSSMRQDNECIDIGQEALCAVCLEALAGATNYCALHRLK